MPDDERAYLPTADEIAAACAEIRATWSHGEFRRRAGLSRQPEPYSIPAISSAPEAVDDALDC